jgi:hypothetical protein
MRARRRGARDDRVAERPTTAAPVKELKATMVAITCRNKKQEVARLIKHLVRCGLAVIVCFQRPISVRLYRAQKVIKKLQIRTQTTQGRLQPLARTERAPSSSPLHHRS